MTPNERRFMRLCERFKLNPSGWIPHIKAEGVYEMGTSYESADEMLDEDCNLREGTPVPIPCSSIYGVFWNICFERRKNQAKLGMRPEELPEPTIWEKLWSFLSDVDTGVYDTAWMSIEQPAVET